jgi:glutathione transport system substrate-binding protein
MLQAGEAQFVAPLPAEMVAVVEKNPKLEVMKQPSIVTWYASMNMLKKPFDNPKVRQALNYAVDKTAYCKVVEVGYCQPLDSPLAPLVPFYVKQGAWPYDPAKAKALLAEAGYPNGFDSEIFAPNNVTNIRAMQFLQQQFALVGVKLTVTPLEAGVANSRIWSVDKPEDATVQLMFGGWSTSTGDADWALRPLFYGKGWPPKLFNVAYYRNPEVDAALEGAIATADPAKRGQLYGKAQQLIWQDAPWVFLGVSQLLSAKDKTLNGVYVLPDRGFVLEEASFQ